MTTCKPFTLLLLVMIFLGGCSTPHRTSNIPSIHNLPPGEKTPEESYWWYCRFKNVWPEDTYPDLVIDLLLAHGVVRPVLVNHQDEIEYWRFHRRAARDSAGHQFSLLVYTRPEVAAQIFAEIHQNELLNNAIAANLVERVKTDNPQNPKNPDIEATSDPNWSVNLQKNWPAFIMGVSSFWLGLIDDSLEVVPKDINDPLVLLEEYRKADAKIAEIWRQEGQHALLHHLNAIFGYKPMTIRKNLTF
ncbi:MAG: hypothetical protein QNJ17_06155 [Desulfocapsaceae bacterium]|nr:hypothetical protein [Desulfocapsaceae bacterium]